MLHVDPVKRLTISEIMVHPWFTPNLPRYLSPLPTPGPVLGTLSSLVQPVKQLDFEIIEGLGRIDEDVVEELAERLEGVDKEEVWEALRREDGPQGNAVKVAYLLLRDKRRKGRDRTLSPLLSMWNDLLTLFEQWLNLRTRSVKRRLQSSTYVPSCMQYVIV